MSDCMWGTIAGMTVYLIATLVQARSAQRHAFRMFELGKKAGHQEACMQAVSTGLLVNWGGANMGVLVKLEKINPPPVN